ncbi:MAG: PrsW family glutamic-type intramembrane protease [Acidimicrobiia bacterium]
MSASTPTAFSPAAAPQDRKTAATQSSVDPAPLWSPAEERALLEIVGRSTPVVTDGWRTIDLGRALLLGSPLAVAIRLMHLVAVVAFVLFVKGLSSTTSWGNLWHSFRYPLYTVALLLIVSITVRRLPAQKLIRYWGLGTMLTTSLVYYLAGPLMRIFESESPDIWLVPPLEEAAKLAPIVVLLAFMRRLKFQYGTADVLVIGFVLGFGFAFTEDALWGRTTADGFRGVWGYLIPGMWNVGDGSVVVGHAVWSAVAAFGLALVVLHWRNALLLMVGGICLVAPTLDHMRSNDHDSIAPWLQNIFIGHYSLPVLFLAAIVLAVGLDYFTLRRVSVRDHLLAPRQNPSQGYLKNQNVDRSFLDRLTPWRYLRLRNGLYYHRAYEVDPWPQKRPADYTVALRMAGRAGRECGALDGNLPAEMGWAPCPNNLQHQRWFNDQGWSPYVVATNSGVEEPIVEAAPDRPEAMAQPPQRAPEAWVKQVAALVVLATAYVVYRVATGSEPEPDVIRFMPVPGGDGLPGGLVGDPSVRLPEVWWTSLPGAGNPPPPWGDLGGPMSGPPSPDPTPPPPPDETGPNLDGPDAPPDSEGPPPLPTGPPNDGPPDDGPPDDPDDTNEDCP